MVFTTQIFTFVFLPLSVIIYLLADRLSCIKALNGLFARLRVKDFILILFSLGFYAWACFDNVFRLLAYIVIVYLLALLISYAKGKGKYVLLRSAAPDGTETAKKFYLSVIPFALAVASVVFVLVYYNYSGFISDCWNKLFGANTHAVSLTAPLGLSFITFSAISYLADIYRGQAEPGSIVDCVLYLSFFPKVISGPIVLYRDFHGQIASRSCDFDKFISGANRIMIGFAKKVILADTFGACLNEIPKWDIDWITAAGTLLLYMLQIYYDFAGYSDIAIGVSKVFGFEFKENFDFPYRSKSITEFWRRWHISLGAWFREYVYFPLGGSRKGIKRTLINLGVVFALTGIWHGAGWNYILWGAINGVLAVIERAVVNKKGYIKTPSAVKYIFTMAVVMGFWQLFRFQTIRDALRVGAIAVGYLKFDAIPYTWQYYYTAPIIVFAIIGILGATVLGSPKIKSVYGRFAATKVGFVVSQAVLLGVFILAIMFMINSTYSPFIYFQY